MHSSFYNNQKNLYSFYKHDLFVYKSNSQIYIYYTQFPLFSLFFLIVQLYTNCMIKKIGASIMLLLVLLCIPTTTSLRHKILSRHYLVELYETNPNATTEFIDSFHTLFDIHRIISHRFLQAVSIEMKDNLTISSLHTHLTVKSISPIQIIHRADSTPALHNLTPVQVGLVSPHRLSQVDKIHHELKLTGQGIFIGLIDTGTLLPSPKKKDRFNTDFFLCSFRCWLLSSSIRWRIWSRI